MSHPEQAGDNQESLPIRVQKLFDAHRDRLMPPAEFIPQAKAILVECESASLSCVEAVQRLPEGGEEYLVTLKMIADIAMAEVKLQDCLKEQEQRRITGNN